MEEGGRLRGELWEAGGGLGKEKGSREMRGSSRMAASERKRIEHRSLLARCDREKDEGDWRRQGTRGCGRERVARGDVGPRVRDCSGALLGLRGQRWREGGPGGQWCRPGQGCRPPLSLNISLFPFKKKTEKRRKRKRRLGWKLGMGIILLDSQK